jgi:hypothetical protein
VSFFDSIPQAPRQQPRRPFWARSDAVIPGSVAAEVVLIRTEQVAVAVGSVRAYPNGFQFTLHGRLRHPDEAAGRGVADPFHRDASALDAQAPGDVLRLGLLYADGRRTATTAGLIVPDNGADGLLLRQEGGGGSNRGWDWDFWVYPLPPDGPVTVVASWLKHGIAETRAELDGTAILAASRRAVILWPDQPAGDVSGSWRSGKITPWSP